SIRWNSPRVASTIALTDSESVTSHLTARHRRPISRTTPAVSSICDSVRAVATISAPASARAIAIARPNPRPAPVTIATLPSRRTLSRTPIGACPFFPLPASFFLELPVAPLQRRLQPLLLRPPIELVPDRRAHSPHRREADPRVFGGEHNVTQEDEVRPAGEAIAMHLPDNRLVHVPERHPHLLRLLQVPDVALHRVRARCVRQLTGRR